MLVVWYAELSPDGLVKTLQILSFSTVSVEHPGDCCQMTNHVNHPACIGCEAAMTQGPSRDHTEQCRTRIIQAISSDVDLSERVREAPERVASDAEPNMKKVRFAEHFHPRFPHHTQSLHLLLIVDHHRHQHHQKELPLFDTCELDDRDEHICSQMLELSEPGNLPSCAPMSADMILSSDDMRLECWLERFGNELQTNRVTLC